MMTYKNFFKTFLWIYLICNIFFFSLNHFDIVLLTFCLPFFLRLEASLLISFKCQKSYFFFEIQKPVINFLNLFFDKIFELIKPFLIKYFFILKKVLLKNFIILKKALLKYFIKKYALLKHELNQLKKENISFNNIFGIFLYYPHNESKKSIFVRFSAVFVLGLSFIFIFYIIFFMDYYFSEDDRSISLILLNIFSIFLIILFFYHIYYSLLHLYNHNSIRDDFINPFQLYSKNFYIAFMDMKKFFENLL